VGRLVLPVALLLPVILAVSPAEHGWRRIPLPRVALPQHRH
jgi:hypothetical protein